MAGFLAYVMASYESYTDELIYRIYITDALSAVVNNTAKFAGGQQIKKRWHDMITGKAFEEQKTEDAEEIVLGVINRAGLGVKV